MDGILPAFWSVQVDAADALTGNLPVDQDGADRLDPGCPRQNDNRLLLDAVFLAVFLTPELKPEQSPVDSKVVTGLLLTVYLQVYEVLFRLEGALPNLGNS